MEHRNMLCTSQIIESEMEQQGQGYVYPGLSFHFREMANLPQPNIRTMVTTASGSSTTFETHYMPEHYDNSMLYGMPQYNGVQNHRSIELGVPPPANFYYSYMNPSSSAGVLPAPLNHGASDQLPSYSSYAVGVPACENGRNSHFIDDIRGPSKRKTPEGVLGYCPQASASPSSSVAHLNTRHSEGVVAPDVASYSLPQYIGNGNPVMDRPVTSGLDSFMMHDHNHIPQQTYIGHPFQPAGTLWMEELNNSSASGGVSAWNQAHGIPFVHDSAEVASVCFPRYHETSGSSRSQSLWHPSPINHRQQNHHSSLPSQGFRGNSVNFYHQATSASYRIPSNVSRNNINPSQNGFDIEGQRQSGMIPQSGIRIYCPHQGATPESFLRQQNLPHLRLLQADEVAMLEIPDFYEVGSIVDHHRDMRLDIEDMSYEELLALEERIGHVSTGLSEEIIISKLKIRTHLSSAISNIEIESSEKKSYVCIICQGNCEHLEKIGTLDCGHEYHVECLKKWLLLKNVCPICKSEALTDRCKE